MDTTRFKDASWFEEASKLQILLIGAGGIGSHFAFNIARCNIKKLIVMDNDTVDIVNTAGQLLNYNEDRVQNKVDALKATLDYFNCNTQFIGMKHKVSELIPVNYLNDFDIVVSAVDNMEARQLIFDSFCQEGVTTEYFMDGRLGPEHFNIFAVSRNEEDMKNYQDSLCLDIEIEPLPCTFKQTTYMASMIGAMMSNIVVNICSKRSQPHVFKRIPFQINYLSPLLNLFV